jgi:hypothetical protein
MSARALDTADAKTLTAPPHGMIWMPDKVEVKSPLVVLP